MPTNSVAEGVCLSGTTEYWINDQTGLPLMVITAELNEKLKSAIKEAIPTLLKETKAPIAGWPVFTMVFDCEAYEPAWFKQLWEKYRVAVISYRKNVNDKWDRILFHNIETHALNTNVTMQLCEMGTLLNGIWFREVRKLSEDGHQTAIITTHPSLPQQTVATKIFSPDHSTFLTNLEADYYYLRSSDLVREAFDGKFVDIAVYLIYSPRQSIFSERRCTSGQHVNS